MEEGNGWERKLRFPWDVAGEITARGKFAEDVGEVFVRRLLLTSRTGRANDPAIARISVEYRGERHSDATTREIFGFASKYWYRSETVPGRVCHITIVNLDARYAFYARLIIRGFSRHIRPNAFQFIINYYYFVISGHN